MQGGYNINTPEYWDQRFGSGDWENKGGREQTAGFVLSFVGHLRIPRNFNGLLLDFGCGLGDALPVLHEHFPQARLMGLDVSSAAVERCHATYGHLACFVVGDAASAPRADIILASNVLEHLSGDEEAAALLLRKCRELYVIVPYREKLVEGGEHVNRYDEQSFARLGVAECTVFAARGWSQFGWERWVDLYAKNLLRPLLGKPTVKRRLQIIYRLVGQPNAA